MIGLLYIVATPIGNLSDITFRAVDILKNVDFVLSEDTRHSKKLFDHYEIKSPLKAFHEHNENEKVNGIISSINSGKSVALITDAGTPLISDPGYQLVSEAKKIGKRRVKLGLFLAELGRKNEITVSDQEMQQAMFEEARKYPGQEKEFFDFVQKNDEVQQQIRAPLFEDKVVDFIIELATVSEKKVSKDNLQKALEKDD